jgi:hypothetical protein
MDSYTVGSELLSKRSDLTVDTEYLMGESLMI